MFHFDYITLRRGGVVFENNHSGGMVTINGQKRFSFDDFLNTFILIENYKHPFTITTTAKRFKRIKKQLEKIGYITTQIRQIDFDMGDENASIYGAHYINLPNPCRNCKRYV
jgi:outer membrane protein assembly factor BamA